MRSWVMVVSGEDDSCPAEYQALFLSLFSNSKRGEASLSDYAETRSHEEHDSSAAKVRTQKIPLAGLEDRICHEKKGTA